MVRSKTTASKQAEPTYIQTKQLQSAQNIIVPITEFLIKMRIGTLKDLSKLY
jgi:hypothetical protein